MIKMKQTIYKAEQRVRLTSTSKWKAYYEKLFTLNVLYHIKQTGAPNHKIHAPPITWAILKEVKVSLLYNVCQWREICKN